MLRILIGVTQLVSFASQCDWLSPVCSFWYTVLPTEIHDRIARVLFGGASTSKRGGTASPFWEDNRDQVGEASLSQTEGYGYYGFQDRRRRVNLKIAISWVPIIPCSSHCTPSFLIFTATHLIDINVPILPRNLKLQRKHGIIFQSPQDWNPGLWLKIMNIFISEIFYKRKVIWRYLHSFEGRGHAKYLLKCLVDEQGNRLACIV